MTYERNPYHQTIKLSAGFILMENHATDTAVTAVDYSHIKQPGSPLPSCEALQQREYDKDIRMFSYQFHEINLLYSLYDHTKNCLKYLNLFKKNRNTKEFEN